MTNQYELIIKNIDKDQQLISRKIERFPEKGESIIHVVFRNIEKYKKWETENPQKESQITTLSIENRKLNSELINKNNNISELNKIIINLKEHIQKLIIPNQKIRVLISPYFDKEELDLRNIRSSDKITTYIIPQEQTCIIKNNFTSCSFSKQNKVFIEILKKMIYESNNTIYLISQKEEKIAICAKKQQIKPKRNWFWINKNILDGSQKEPKNASGVFFVR